MNIKDAINTIKNAIAGFDKDSQTVLRLAIKALGCSGAEELPVSARMDNLLASESRLNGTQKWAEDVYIAALAMKRQIECKQYYQNNKHVIDGETVSMWVSTISAILGIVATLMVAILMSFNFIESVDIDRLAYIIGLAGWLVTIIVTIVARLINKHQVKKHNSSSDYTVKELMAVKYEDSNKVVKALLPPEIKRSKIHVKHNVDIGKLEITNSALSPNVPDVDIDGDLNITEIKM